MAAPLVFGALLGKEIIGETIEGGFRLAAASISAAGSVAGGALNAAGSIIGGAAAGATAPAPVTIVKSTGVVGQVGKSKITGRPPAPQLKSGGGPTAVNDNMPVGQLLVTAVNYLSSIDSTLKEQIKFEYQTAQKQSLAEREAAVEDTRGGTFTQLRDRFSTVKDSASRAKSLIKPLLAATGLAGLAAIGISQLDTSELDRLKQNWQNFQDQFGWLIPLGSILGGAYIGARLGGGPGAIAGALAAAIIPYLFGGGGDGQGVGISGGLATTGIVGGLGLAGVSATRGVRGFNERRARLRTQTGPRGVAATQKGFFGGPKWKKFESWLAKKGKRKLLRKIQTRIALLGAGAAITATGVGAVFGILMTLVNVGMSLFLVYEIWSLWRQWETEEEDTVTDAEAVAEGQPDAVAANAPLTAADGGNIPANVEKILATIRTKESGGNYGAQNPGGSASGAYQFIDSTWQSLTQKYGIGTEYSKAKDAPPAIQDAVAAAYVQDILRNNGNDVSKVPLVWYTGNAAGNISASALAANNGLTPQAYQADWMSIYTGGQYSPSSNTGGGAGGGLMGSLGDIATGIGRAATRIVKAASGEYKPRRLTESLNQDKAAAIGSMSSSISNMTNFGTGSEKIKENETASSIINALRNTAVAAGEPTVGALDPNYKNRDVVDGYLQYFNMKAA
jgi:Na+-transporting methylmalonyl-CoA/oxaloacetate decarboxylase gamma subunit/peptidyl-tRNA hydrolase